jgi:hypothetical protein
MILGGIAKIIEATENIDGTRAVEKHLSRLRTTFGALGCLFVLAIFFSTDEESQFSPGQT